jgi:hypothetical protein
VALDVFLKAAAAIVTGAFALLALVGARQRRAGRLLAFFLGLIFLNQAFETARALAPPPLDPLLLLKAASICSALDPVVLLALAAELLGRRRAWRAGAWALRAVAAVVVVVELSRAKVGGAFDAPNYLPLVEATLVYSFVAFTLARRLRGSPPDRAIAPLFVAMCVAAIPLWSAAAYDLAGAAIRDPTTLPGLPIGVVATLAAAALLALAPSSRAYRLVGPLAGVLVTLSTTLAPTLIQAALGGGAAPPWALALGKGTASVRWLIVGALASTAVLRHDVLDMGVVRRRRAARVLLGISTFGAVAFLLFLVQVTLPGSGSFTLIDAVVLGLAVAASQAFRAFLDAVASRAYGIPGASPGAAAEEGPLREGAVLAERYRVVRRIGRGGEGHAFLAQDSRIDRAVVLKEVAEDADARGVREARAAGQIAHPNVVVVHDVLPLLGSSVLVMEHVPGGTLAERAPLEAGEAVRMLEGVLAGLEAAHARGIVHRDLKAANVLVAADGSPKVADFGIAWLRESTTAGFHDPGVFAGTPAFMAPEQRRGEPVTPATDVYAAGRLLRAIAVPPLPPALVAIVEKATADDPLQRYPDAGAMRAALRQATLTP